MSKVTETIHLKDGRILLTTHNGFKKWLQSGKEIIPVTEQYFNNAKRLRTNAKN
jgi:hypothetical protein